MNGALSPHLASSCAQRASREARRVPTDTELREIIAREAGGAAGGLLCPSRRQLHACSCAHLGPLQHAVDRRAADAEPLGDLRRPLALPVQPTRGRGRRAARGSERDADRWVRHADVRRGAKGGQNKAQVRVWRAFT